MNNILELENTRHSNAYIGYADDILKFLRKQVAETMSTYYHDGSDTEIKEAFEYVKEAIKVIDNIETQAKDYDLVAVWNILEDGFGWSFALPRDNSFTEDDLTGG